MKPKEFILERRVTEFCEPGWTTYRVITDPKPALRRGDNSIFMGPTNLLTQADVEESWGKSPIANCIISMKTITESELKDLLKEVEAEIEKSKKAWEKLNTEEPPKFFEPGYYSKWQFRLRRLWMVRQSQFDGLL